MGRKVAKPHDIWSNVPAPLIIFRKVVTCIKIQFSEFLNNLRKLEHHNEILCRVVELYEQLKSIDLLEISIGAHYILELFYICPIGTLNLYWRTITIQTTEVSKREGFPDVSVANSTIEIVMPETAFPASCLLAQVGYLKTSCEVIDEISSVLIKYEKDFVFDENCLYFSIY